MRQLSADAVCDSKAEKLLKLMEREVIAMVKGLAQGAQETETKSSTGFRKTRTAVLLSPVKLQFTTEFLADKRSILGNDITAADSRAC